MAKDASIDTGKSLMQGGGRWATERFAAALKAGASIGPNLLRTADTLHPNEWKHFDSVVVREGALRLRGIADLINLGLTMDVPNAMGKMLVEWDKITDMDDADVSLSGLDETPNTGLEFERDSIPLPITHKDFNINLRTLAASRNMGIPLDTTQAETAARKVGEKLEEMLFVGGKTFGGKTIYGYLTHPHVNDVHFHDAETWDSATKDGEEIVVDVMAGISALEADRFYGPYRLYIPSAYNAKMETDFKAYSSLTIRQRLKNIDRITDVVTVDKLTADKVVLAQMTRDVVCLVNGEGIQTVQWDLMGGFNSKFKVFAIQVPLIRSDVEGRCGVCIIQAA